MEIPDIFRLNEWPRRKLIIVVGVIYLTFIASTYLSEFLLCGKVIRVFSGFILATFLPGYLLLWIINIKLEESSKTLLFAVGISLTLIMIVGVLSNFLFRSLGYDKPLSFRLFLSLLSLLFIILIVIIWFFSIDDHNIPKIKISHNLFIGFLLFLFVPISSISAVSFLNIYQDSMLVMIFIAIVCSVFILIPFKKVEEELYPFIVYVMSLSILYHTSLVSSTIWGWDTHFLVYTTSKVRETLYWDPNIISPGNDLLVISVLPVVYSILLDIQIKWVYKLIFPFIYSFVPVGIYFIGSIVSKNYINIKNYNKLIGVLGSFIFIFYYGFFKEIPTKQEIAEFFF